MAKTILIVEDNDLDMKLFNDRLEANGYDTIQTRDIPVVAATAFAIKGDEEKIRQGGCDGYIAKPISVPKFLATVD